VKFVPLEDNNTWQVLSFAPCAGQTLGRLRSIMKTASGPQRKGEMFRPVLSPWRLESSPGFRVIEFHFRAIKSRWDKGTKPAHRFPWPPRVGLGHPGQPCKRMETDSLSGPHEIFCLFRNLKALCRVYKPPSNVSLMSQISPYCTLHGAPFIREQLWSLCRVTDKIFMQNFSYTFHFHRAACISRLL
jgi:hypothetical protein